MIHFLDSQVICDCGWKRRIRALRGSTVRQNPLALPNHNSNPGLSDLHHYAGNETLPRGAMWCCGLRWKNAVCCHDGTRHHRYQSELVSIQDGPGVLDQSADCTVRFQEQSAAVRRVDADCSSTGSHWSRLHRRAQSRQSGLRRGHRTEVSVLMDGFGTACFRGFMKTWLKNVAWAMIPNQSRSEVCVARLRNLSRWNAG